MQRAMMGRLINDLIELCNIVKKIPMHELMFFIPEKISTYNEENGLALLSYKTTNESLTNFIKSGNMVVKEREMYFYKKHIIMSLEELHNHNIFYYFHIDDLYIHNESKMPILSNFETSCILDFNNEEKRKNILEIFSKPIKNKYVPFSLFFFHFIAFSLTKDRSAKKKEVSIYELYDNNESIFYCWNQDELKEVENIVREGKDYEGIFNYYLENSALWFHWDYVMLERCFMKLM